MNDLVRLALVGAAIVLAFDTVAAVLSRAIGIEYGWFSLGSFSIYVLFGYLVARKSKWFYGGIVGAFLGLVESTIGWMISWYIGPGRLTAEIDSFLIAVTIILVVGVAAVLGLIGGATSLFKRPGA